MSAEVRSAHTVVDKIGYIFSFKFKTRSELRIYLFVRIEKGEGDPK